MRFRYALNSSGKVSHFASKIENRYNLILDFFFPAIHGVQDRPSVNFVFVLFLHFAGEPSAFAPRRLAMCVAPDGLEPMPVVPLTYRRHYLTLWRLHVSLPASFTLAFRDSFECDLRVNV